MLNARLTVEQRVRCVRLFSLTSNVTEVQRRMRKEFGVEPPKVYSHPINSIEQLKDVITHEFNQIPVDMCRKACENVPLRLQACIDNDGGMVDFAMENRD